MRISEKLRPNSPASLILPYRPDIDGLRAIAVLLVVAYHAFPEWVTGGFIGVDIFFVISGYLITGIIMKNLEAGSFSLADFYIRRCCRILPALFTMLIAVFCLGLLLLLPTEFRDLGRAILAAAAFSENILLASEAGYFDLEAVRKPLLHLWSLAVEEQFYVLWPLALLFIFRHGIKTQKLAFALMATSFAFAAYYFTIDAAKAFYLLPSRLWEILAGACLFYVEARRSTSSLKTTYKNWQALAALITIFILSFTFYVFFLFEKNLIFLVWSALSCFAVALLISAGENSWINHQLLSNPAFVWIGRISYPLYLWHWPLLSIAQILEDEQPILEIRLCILALSLVLAWLTFRYIEQPAQKFFRGQRAQFVAISAIVGTLAIAALGYLAFSHSTSMARGDSMLEFSDIDRTNLHTITDSKWWQDNQINDEACLKSSWNPYTSNPHYCRLTGNPPHVAIFGDSQSNQLIHGLISLNDSDFSRIVQVSAYSFGCTNMPVNCNPASHGFLQSVSQDPTIRYAIISMDINHGNPTHSFDPGASTFVPDSIRNSTELLYTQLFYLIQHLEKSGKQVIFVLGIPDLGIAPTRCINVRQFTMTSRARVLCARPRDEVMAQQKPIRAILTALAEKHPQMIVFDPASALCDQTNCYGIRDKKLLYRDPTHLSVDGSVFIANAFKASLIAHH